MRSCPESALSSAWAQQNIVLSKILSIINITQISTQIGTKQSLNKWRLRTSLVAQWLRISLPMQGTRVRALVQKDPTCRGATKLVRHNY